MALNYVTGTNQVVLKVERVVGYVGFTNYGQLLVFKTYELNRFGKLKVCVPSVSP